MKKDTIQKNILFKITTEQIQALLEGKKIVYQYEGLPQVTLMPDRYGYFVTHEKYHELKRRMAIGILVNPDDVLNMLKDIFPLQD